MKPARRGGRLARRSAPAYPSVALDGLSSASRPPKAPESIRVIGCGMLAREIAMVREARALQHIDLTCLPAEFHFHPERIAPALDHAISSSKAAGFERIFVAYADCGSGGEIDRVCSRHGVERIAGPHCFAFYIGNDRFAARGDAHMRDFLMTDFLARHFDAFFLRPLGLDLYPDLIETYFGQYERLVYLAQTVDPVLEKTARDAARLLGLTYVREFTGMGDLELRLADASRSL